MNNGWIQLHRNLLDWEWYSDIKVTRVFLHCLLKANHADKKWQGIVINRGSFITSISKLSEETGLTPQNVRTCIKKLKSTGEICSKSTNKMTILSICNYDTYQDSKNSTNKQLTSNQQATNNQLTTNNNDNNNNKEKKESETRARTYEEFRETAKSLFVQQNAMECFEPFCEYWCVENKYTEEMRWQEDPYFHAPSKVRSWLDRERGKNKPKIDFGRYPTLVSKWVSLTGMKNVEVAATVQILNSLDHRITEKMLLVLYDSEVKSLGKNINATRFHDLAIKKLSNHNPNPKKVIQQSPDEQETKVNQTQLDQLSRWGVLEKTNTKGS